MADSRKEEILSRDLDMEQLKAASGGRILGGEVKYCKKTARRSDCQATVEAHSWCGRNDACLICSNKYGTCSKESVDLKS